MEVIFLRTHLAVLIAIRLSVAAKLVQVGGEKNQGFCSDVSVLTGDLDGGERMERIGASLGGAPRFTAVV